VAVIFRGRKGQAALTDAMFFLLIVTGLSVFLYFFANSFGENVNRALLRQSNSDFAASTLATILYSSTPRDPNGSIYDKDAEIDHLLAYIKEDYASHGPPDTELLLSPDTKKVIASDIKAILSPISNSFDYLFFIWVPSSSSSPTATYVVSILHMSNIASLCNYYLKNPGLPKPEMCSGFNPDDPASQLAHIDLFCNNLSVDKVSKLYSRTGTAGQAFSKIKLVKKIDPSNRSSDSFDESDAEADFIIWSPVDVVQLTQDWGCSAIP